MLFGDPLANATKQLLSAVEQVTEAMNEKKRIITECETSIKSAIEAVNDAKKTLNM